MSQGITQAQVVSSQSTLNPGQAVEQIALFNPDGTVWTPSATPGVAVTDIATADATDEASAVTLANATKVKVNALLDSLRDAGLLDS